MTVCVLFISCPVTTETATIHQKQTECSAMAQASALWSTKGVRIIHQKPQQEGPSLGSEMWHCQVWICQIPAGISARCHSSIPAAPVLGFIFHGCSKGATASSSLPRDPCAFGQHRPAWGCLRKDFTLGDMGCFTFMPPALQAHLSTAR